jgi:1,4-dihydroxy-2-naphthoyl-CoA synthase
VVISLSLNSIHLITSAVDKTVNINSNQEPIMSSIPDQIPLPASYKDLPFREIVLSHIPENSASPTPTILITLYRPGKHNAFTKIMENELIHAFTLIDVDPRVKCAIVTGHGRIFCAGADLETAFKGGEEPVREHRDGGGRVALAVHKCRKPIIGALQGSAVGIGITMTLPMSIRIAYEGAKIGFVFARRGLVMEACSSYYLPRLIGYVFSSIVIIRAGQSDMIAGCPKPST